MITAFWWNVDNAVKNAIKMRIPTEVNGIHFCYKSGMLLIKLPSGRVLSYVKPKIGENRFGGESVTYEASAPPRNGNASKATVRSLWKILYRLYPEICCATLCRIFPINRSAAMSMMSLLSNVRRIPMSAALPPSWVNLPPGCQTS